MEPKVSRNGRPDEAKDSYLDWVRIQIEQDLGCPAYYLRTEIVHELVEENTVWLGEVEVFGLIGHHQANRCFAWGNGHDQSDRNGEVAIVLEVLPIACAQHAVRAQLRMAGCDFAALANLQILDIDCC